MTEAKTCLVCGKAFEAPVHKKGRHAVYCSNSCRCKAARLGIKAPTVKDLPPTKCPVCGRVFRQDRVKRYRKYCSCACAGIAKRTQTLKCNADRVLQRRQLRPKAPVSYKEICRANRRRGLQDGWRGTPCMGGGAVAWTTQTPR